MRANITDYELKSVKNLKEALTLLDNKSTQWKPFAGGTDLMVIYEAGKLNHKKFVNILNLKELKKTTSNSKFLNIGALYTYSDIQSNPLLQAEFSILCKAAAETGAVAIQNRGTIGGNIANACPAADSPPALLVLDTEIELVSIQGVRMVSYLNFHTGYKKTVMRPNELIQNIKILRTTKGYSQYYRKVGTRNAQAISKICMAGLIKVENKIIKDIRIALGSVAPTAIRCPKTEAFLIGKKINDSLINNACDEIQKEIAPIDDIRSTKVYRSKVTTNLLRDLLMKHAPSGAAKVF